MKTQQPTLVIIAKRPSLGHGKQRIAQTMGEQAALLVADALFQCAIEDGFGWFGPVAVAMSDTNDLAWAKAHIPNSWALLAQGSGNLGQRLNHIDQQLRRLGHGSLVFIGTDAPVLDSAYFEAVKVQLCQTQVVLGEAEDGGVVVMANNAPWPDLAQLAWSTEQLATDLKQVCISQKMSVGKVESSFDIDTEADLYKLIEKLATDARPARQALLKVIQPMLDKKWNNSYA